MPRNSFMENFCDSILTCKESAEFEADFFKGDAQKELFAMRQASKKIAEIILGEFGRILETSPKILVLSGSGHNGGDALGAALEILNRLPSSKIDVFFTDKNRLKPNTQKICGELFSFKNSVFEVSEISGKYDLVLEGLAGMSLKPPLRKGLERAIVSANALSAKLKVSVDLPAGMSDEPCGTVFKSDLCVMAGIAKAPLFNPENRGIAGRLRYADLGFLPNLKTKKSIVSERVLKPLLKLRNVCSDKRSYGHLFVFAGSRNYAGAALMNVKAAIRSGVGLVSAFVPENLAPSFAAAEPAAIWIPCPTTEDGSLSLETFSLFRERAGKETAVLAGSGLSGNPETLALVSEVLRHTEAKVVLDADAISKSVIASAKENRTLITPHHGEFLRVARSVDDGGLSDFSQSRKIAVLLKSELSRIADGSNFAFNISGSPILSRAGSGDILAGIAGGLLARADLDFTPFEAGCAAAFIAGKIAEKACLKYGENAYSSSCAFDFFREIF